MRFSLVDEIMPLPRFKLTVPILVITTFSGWFALFRSYPTHTMLGFIIGMPIFVLLVFEMMLDNVKERDRERSAVYITFLWIGLSGIIAFLVYFTLRRALPLP
jgi:hypothetical protein